jgi:hypothetical protein
MTQATPNYLWSVHSSLMNMSADRQQPIILITVQQQNLNIFTQYHLMSPSFLY